MTPEFHAFFDETGTHAGSSRICVAGYLFFAEGANEFARLWEARVRPLLPSGVEVFHSSGCIGEREKKDEILHTLVQTIKETMVVGAVVAIEKSAYEAEAQRQPQFRRILGSAYSVCAMRCAQYMAVWLERNALAGRIKYFFEAGNEHEGEAKHFLSQIEQNRELKERYRMDEYSFVPKGGAPQLQAADLLAWEWQRNHETAMNPEHSGREWRPTLTSLCERPHYAELLTGTRLGILAMVNLFYGLQSNRLSL